MNFIELFKKTRPKILWDDKQALWHCEGCGRLMDKPEKELHWKLQNCSLSKLNSKRKLREIIISDNLELYKKYCLDNGIKFIPIIEPRGESFPLSWYKNQIKNFNNLPMNIGELSGAAVEEAEPIPLRKLTAEDLIPKICRKHNIVTGDDIIDSIPMADEPWRDLLGDIIIEDTSDKYPNPKLNYTRYYTLQDVEDMKDPIIKAEWKRQQNEWLNKWEPERKTVRGRIEKRKRTE